MPALTGTNGDMRRTRAGKDGTAVAFDLSGRRRTIATRPADPQPHRRLERQAPARHVPRLPRRCTERRAVRDRPRGRDATWARSPTACPTDHRVGSGTGCATTGVAITPDGATVVMGADAFLEESATRARPRSRRGPLRRGDAGAAGGRGGAMAHPPRHRHPHGNRAVISGRAGYAIVDIPSARLVGEPVPLDEAVNIEWIEGVCRLTGWSPRPWHAMIEVVLVDLASGTVARRGKVAKEVDNLVQALAWSANSRTLVAAPDADGSTGGRQRRWNRSRRTAHRGRRILDLEVSPDGEISREHGSDGGVTLSRNTRSWPPGQPLTDTDTWRWPPTPPTAEPCGSSWRARRSSRSRPIRLIGSLPRARAAGRNLSPRESAGG